MFSPGLLNAQSSEQARGGVRSHADTGGRCSACHVPPWSKSRMDDRCIDCHIDLQVQLSDPRTLHGALMSGGPLACRTCHTDHNGPEASLTILVMSDFPHEKVGFSLQGHPGKSDKSSFVCADCHPQSFTTFDVSICETCHREFDASYIETHITYFGRGCLACHDGVDTYGDTFDHNLLPFPLEGGHAQFGCSECHPAARTRTDLRIGHQTCYTCHEKDDAHAGGFGENCAACHTPTSWDQASFDHTLSSFPLTGAHNLVGCAQCHIGGVFAGTSTTCVGCHGDPDFHLSLFGTDCVACHTTEAWSPAMFDKPHVFPFDHGSNARSECKVCHPDSLFAYTCYGCHEHIPADVERKHREEGMTNFSNCIECHPTGREDEGGEGEGDD